MNKANPTKPLVIVVMAGILSLIASALVMVYPFHAMYDNISPWSLANTGLIICEVFITVAFALIAGLALILLPTATKLKNRLRAAGVARLLLMVLIYAVFWKDWKFIFRLDEFHPGALILPLFGLTQIIFLLVAANRTK